MVQLAYNSGTFKTQVLIYFISLVWPCVWWMPSCPAHSNKPKTSTVELLYNGQVGSGQSYWRLQLFLAFYQCP